MIKLRALEPEDIDFLYHLENEESLWEVSETQLPFAKHLLQDYIQHAYQDIYEAKQYRYVIAIDEKPLGCVDLYDFSPKHHRAAVGIALLPNYQGKGYGKALIDFIIEKYKGKYSVLQVGTGESQATIPFYEKCGFIRSHTIKNFFIDNYDHPIYEEGILLVDMVYLKMDL